MVYIFVSSVQVIFNKPYQVYNKVFGHGLHLGKLEQTEAEKNNGFM